MLPARGGVRTTHNLTGGVNAERRAATPAESAEPHHCAVLP